MSFWSKVKNALNINRKFNGADLWIGGFRYDIKTLNFMESVDYEFIESKGRFKLKSDIKVTIYWKKNGTEKANTIFIPKGFEWDGASIPESLQWLIGGKFDPEFIFASCVHDRAVGMDLEHYPESRIFYEILKTRKGKLNIPKWKEKAMYIAVYAWSLYKG